MSTSGADAFGRWLESREPPVPAAVRGLLEQAWSAGGGEDGEARSPAFAAAARAGLLDALAGEGERAGAFRLLAADAFVTYACELALESDDPEAALRDVVREIVATAEVG